MAFHRKVVLEFTKSKKVQKIFLHDLLALCMYYQKPLSFDLDPAGPKVKIEVKGHAVRIDDNEQSCGKTKIEKKLLWIFAYNLNKKCSSPKKI